MLFREKAALCPELGSDILPYIEAYRLSKEDCIFCKVYIQLFPYARKIMASFRLLDDADKVSFALMSLYQALVRFDGTLSTPFAQFYGLLLSRKLIDATRYCASIYSPSEPLQKEPVSREASDSFRFVEYCTSLEQNTQLTTKELEFCKVVVERDPSYADLQKLLGYTRYQLDNLLTQLRFKIRKEDLRGAVI